MDNYNVWQAKQHQLHKFEKMFQIEKIYHTLRASLSCWKPCAVCHHLVPHHLCFRFHPHHLLNACKSGNYLKYFKNTN